MGDPVPSRPVGEQGARSGRDIPWKLVVLGALALYGVLIVLLNRKQVEVSFVLFSAEISLLVLILLCLGVGFAAGYLFEELRARRRRSG